MILPLKAFAFGRYTWNWCKMPYKGNPKGCPMYNTRAECPPQCQTLDELLNLNHYKMICSVSFGYRRIMESETPNLYLVYQEYDLALQEYKMQEKHENWSVKQCRCCRYYQRGLDNRIMKEAEKFISNRKGYTILKRPEANGLNCFSTLRFHDIKLEKNYETQDKIMKMVLVGPAKEPTGLEKWFERSNS